MRVMPCSGRSLPNFFRDAPELKPALEDVAKGKTKAADAARRVMATGQKNSAGPVAKDADIPRVLRDRPWRKSADAKKPIAVALAPKKIEERIDLEGVAPQERTDARAMTASELAKWRAAVKDPKGYASADIETAYKKSGVEYLRVPEDEGLRAWNRENASIWNGYGAYLAKHGVAAIDGFVARDWAHGLEYSEVDEEPIIPVLARILSPRTAPVMARIAMRRKNFKRAPLAWLVEHAELAAYGLVPNALGPPGEKRDEAEGALAHMVAHGARDALRKVARVYGEDAARAIDVLLARDPYAIDVTPPKPPEFLRVSDLSRPTLAAGARLGDDAFDALLELLRVAPIDGAYPGILDVRRACDAASLGDLSREIFDQWVMAGFPGRFEWMLFSAAHFPSDEGTRRVAEIARDWARRDRKKAPRACLTLAAIATDAALMHLGHIAATSRFEDVRALAGSLLDEVAAAQNLTRDELEDRTVADLDLGAARHDRSFLRQARVHDFAR